MIRLAPEESLHRLNNRQLKLMIEKGFLLSFYANLKLYNELALSKNKSNKNMSMFVRLPFATRVPRVPRVGQVQMFYEMNSEVLTAAAEMYRESLEEDEAPPARAGTPPPRPGGSSEGLGRRDLWGVLVVFPL